MEIVKNLTFGNWVVLKEMKKRSLDRHILFLCLCICGTKRIVKASNLRNGQSTSCGCMRLEKLLFGAVTHNSSYTGIYKTYRGMIARCTNPNTENYKYYGGRGIKVCERWLGKEGFIHFKADLGLKPTSLHTLDRIDVMGNYSPENCRWATSIEQKMNTRNSVHSIDIVVHNKWKKFLQKIVIHALFKSKIISNYIKYFDCTIIELRNHISSKFTEGMTWNNHGKHLKNGGKVWNIDHIIPCNKFDLAIKEDRYRCFHYTNLRPKWGKDNLSEKLR